MCVVKKKKVVKLLKYKDNSWKMGPCCSLVHQLIHTKMVNACFYKHCQFIHISKTVEQEFNVISLIFWQRYCIIWMLY